jgi:hypothetical protein
VFQSFFVLGTMLCGLAAAAENEPSFPKSTILDYYIKLTFSDDATSEPARVPGLLAKRDGSARNKVIMSLGDSALSSDAHIQEITDDVGEVLGSLAAHSKDFRYKFYSIDEVLGIMKMSHADAQEALADSLQIYVGSVDEIDGATKQQEGHGLKVRSLFEAARSRSSQSKIPLCFGGVFYKPDLSNEIGYSVLYAEDGNALMNCLYEGIMRSAGLMEKLPDGSYSTFGDDGLFSSPTQLDWALWALHMNPKLSHGMTISQTRQMASQVLDTDTGE